MLLTPQLMHSENHAAISSAIGAILDARRSAFGEAGCPVALVTDNIRRDHEMAMKLLREKFPYAMTRPDAAFVCQDIIHRVWAFTRVIPKAHADCDAATRDIKAIFSVFT